MKLTVLLSFFLILPVFAASNEDLSVLGVEAGILIFENPANYRAEFEIITAEPSNIRVLVYDNLGNVLFSANGSTENVGNVNRLRIIWDLNGRNGRRVSAGTYTIQATAMSSVSNQIWQHFAQLGVRR